MADVEISYKGNTIASMSASGAKTLLTKGKYCEDDINVVYMKSGTAPDTSFSLKNFKVPSNKWVVDQAVDNLLRSGGCIHIKFTVPETLVSTDTEVISIGADALSSWTPSTNCSMFGAIYNLNNANTFQLRIRGTSLNSFFSLSLYEDANREFEVKIYSDRLINVKTNTTYLFSDYPGTVWDALNTAITNLCTHEFISVGVNQMSTRYAGKMISIFAIEAE